MLVPTSFSQSGRAKLPLLILAGTVVVAFLLVSTKPKIEEETKPERTWTVDAVEARIADARPELELFGEVVAGRRSELRALVPGPIVEVGPGFRDGGSVTAGDLLVQIDPFDYETALAEQTALLQEAEVRLEVLQRDLVRIENLYEEKNVSEQMLDDAMLAVEQQQAALKQRRIGVQRARRDLDDTRLTAPFDGVVNNVGANLGKLLSTNDKVADLIETVSLEVRFSLTNAQYGRLLDSSEPLQGRQVRVRWQVGNQELAYDAEIDRVGAEISSGTGGVDVFALISSPEAADALRPGAFVWVNMPDRLYSSVASLPETALYGESGIFLIRDERLVADEVDVVGFDGDHVLVRPRDGGLLANGEQVLITQIREGGAGVKVEVR